MTASATPLTVAVLGAGNIGRPLARHWLAAGHTVAIGSRTPGEPTDLTTPAGAPVSTVSHADAVDAGDVVLLSVPHPALEAVLDGLGDRLAGKTVIDATSPIGLSDDGHFVSQHGPGVTQGGWTAKRLPSSTVTRAFTHFPDELLWSRGTQQPHFWGMGLAADDADARRTTETLVHDSGFTPVWLGGLDASAALDPGGALFGYFSTAAGLRTAAGLDA